MQFVHKAKEVNCKVSLLEHLSVVGEALFSEFWVQAHQVKKLMLSVTVETKVYKIIQRKNLREYGHFEHRWFD